MQNRSPIRLQLDPHKQLSGAYGLRGMSSWSADGPHVVTASSQVEASLARLLGVEREGVRVLAGGPDAAVDAALLTLLRPGDVVVAPVNGPLSAALAERAARAGAEVIVVEHGFGEAVELPRIESALWARGARLCLAVHADTVTGMAEDPAPLCALARAHGALALVDCCATLGAAVVDARAWGAAVVCAGAAAGLGAPPGVALLGIGAEARAAIDARRTPPVAWTLDLTRIEGASALAPTLLLDLCETLAAVDAAGPPALRRMRASLRDGLAAGLRALGLTCMGGQAPALVIAAAPECVDAERVRSRMMAAFGVEVGVFEDAKGWRCSLLAPGPEPADIRLALAAFCDALRSEGIRTDLATALAAADLLLSGA